VSGAWQGRRLHFIGVGGAGMSAYARAAHALGASVSGSDAGDGPYLRALRAEGVLDAVVGHAAQNVPAGEGVEVVHSSAVGADNVELGAARERGLVVHSRASLLAELTRLKRTIAVGGTHGKTTTSSMVVWALRAAGLDPSWLIGGPAGAGLANGHWSEGEWLVVEADESDGTFLSLAVDIAVVTNVEADHLDYYGSFASVRAAFEEFVAGARHHRVVGGDDAVAAAIGRASGADVVGTGPDCSHRIVDLQLSRSSIAFDLVGPTGTESGRLSVPVPGAHNARNAAVATVAALAAGVPFSRAADALARFAGVARRFEFRGEARGVTFVDDYAHLPSEVRAALAAARNGDWARVVAVFQPHRYSRTAVLGTEFGRSFDDADLVVVTDVYGAGESPVPGVTGATVAEAVVAASPGKPVLYAPGRAELRRTVGEVLMAGDLCCTLGAGDLTSLPDELMSDPGW
jgi:UDP-N-acetylmuramate--alanine ligase